MYKIKKEVNFCALKNLRNREISIENLPFLSALAVEGRVKGSTNFGKDEVIEKP